MSTPTCQVPSPNAVNTRPGTDTFGLRPVSDTAGAANAGVAEAVGIADRANTAPTAPTVPRVRPAARPPTAAGQRRRSDRSDVMRAGATRTGRAATAGPRSGSAGPTRVGAGGAGVAVAGRGTTGDVTRCVGTSLVAAAGRSWSCEVVLVIGPPGARRDLTLG